MLLPLLCMFSPMDVCLTTFHKTLAIIHVHQQAQMNESMLKCICFATPVMQWVWYKRQSHVQNTRRNAYLANWKQATSKLLLLRLQLWRKLWSQMDWLKMTYGKTIKPQLWKKTMIKRMLWLLLGQSFVIIFRKSGLRFAKWDSGRCHLLCLLDAVHSIDELALDIFKL